ncbi:hypothetical protein IV203_027324 [Nitzschia inconspicua]|uniref:Uncharacterized protein n=1 Tax=Nitzschia inconspicua TaxID=303405 RepID=A0A9K3LW28_9STRA|nr:hypothetical protein IV203_027324 [Nitzschia inconspicua]
MMFKINAAFLVALAGANAKTLRKLQDDSRICSMTELSPLSDDTKLLLSTTLGGQNVIAAYEQYMGGETIGSNTALLAEASDASASPDTVVEDGMSGDIDFPFMDMKVVATMGERSVCPDSLGEMLVGVPDGIGAYLLDDETVRVVFQSESYGPLVFESYGNFVNDGQSRMGGSHVQYIDYDRTLMSEFMDNDEPASSMVVGMGQVISTMYNLKGELIGPRNLSGPTTIGAHFSNTDADGNYVVAAPPAESDWFLQSLCSAHLEQKHQWGPNLGVEDDMFITNEEWMTYAPGTSFVGLSAHAVDLANSVDYALGVFTLGGFEKIVEINPEVEGYTMFAFSGYNGAFDGFEHTLDMRNSLFKRSDGQNYTWSNDIHPARFYIGVKGKMEDGSDAPEDDFLARNGLRYGYIYGFAIDMSEDGPTGGLWRDDFHRDAEKATNGAKVDGWWIKQPWQWDGQVRNFEFDGSWDYQDQPPYTGEGSGRENYAWWNGMGNDMAGCKTEHVTPDPRPSVGAAFVQGSTCGYFGHYYVEDVVGRFESLRDGQMAPNAFRGSYYVYQGELDITEQIELGGKGQYVNGDATMNYDNPEDRITFEDIDGLEVLADGDELYVLIQEDSGNQYGERAFLAHLEHEDDGEELTYYFLAMSGGTMNTRMQAGVSVPKGTFTRATAHEFSGVVDLSAFFATDDSGDFVLSASDDGFAKRQADASVAINDKDILLVLQAHTQSSGILSAFQLDRGGQIYQLKPKLPEDA